MSASTTALERRVPLLDLRALHAATRDEILAAMTRVVDSNAFILGDDVRLLEKSIAEYCGVPFAIGCASGSDALFLALLAAEVTLGDEVITTPFTFFATAGAIVRAGTIPVFVDIDPLTFNMDPERLEVALLKHPKAKVILPVHLFGGCADMDPINAQARKHGCRVIEDGAQAIGAAYKTRPALSLGDIGCISFFPSKNLGGFGDGGMLTTADENLAKRLSALRVHGAARKYFHDFIGINSRLDTLQAAVLRVKFKYLEQEAKGRQRNAGLYRELLSNAGIPVTLPQARDYQTCHVYNQFVIRTPRRDELKLHLQEHGVGTEVYYPLSLHQQACFRDLGYHDGDFPISECAAREVLALPIHSAVSSEDIEYVSQTIRKFWA